MWYIILLIIVAVSWLVYSNINRGKQFVRAVDFLMQLDGGATAEEANEGCKIILTNNWPEELNRQAIDRAIREADLHYNGKQLPLIRFAISKGFEG